jgi:hypothetical protein
MTITRTFYYASHTKEQEKEYLLTLETGSTSDCAKILYSDKELTKKIGIFRYKRILLDNTKKVAVLDVEFIITTNEGTIKYKYTRDSYKKITVNTEETSGIFTKGTVTRNYVTSDKSIRKLVYTSAE